jgi:hypothetical protein
MKQRQEADMRDRTREHGKGTLSTLVWLAVLAGVVYMALNVGPAYISHWTLADKMNEVARLPHGLNTDERLRELIMKTVREEGIDPWIKPQAFQIHTLESSRRINVEYDREVKFLPGLAPKIIHFTAQVDQPIAY